MISVKLILGAFTSDIFVVSIINRHCERSEESSSLLASYGIFATLIMTVMVYNFVFLNTLYF